MYKMSTVLLSLMLILGLSSLSMSQSNVVRESFPYPTDGGTILGMGGTQNGWAGPWHKAEWDSGVSDSLFWAAKAGIEYGDMNYDVPHIGNLLYGSRDASKYARYERKLDKVWTPDDGTVYWFSVIMELQNDTSSSTWAGVKLCQDTTSDAAIMFGKGYGNDVYCINGYHGGPTDHPEEQTSYTWDSGPVWLVGEIFNRGDGNASYVYMWVSPDPETEPDTSSADARSYGSILSPGIANIKVEYGGSIPFEMAVDEIRMGTSFTDVSSGLVTPGYLASESFVYPTGGGTILGMGDALDGWADAWHKAEWDSGVSDSLFWVADAGIDYGDMNYEVPYKGNLLYGSRDASKYARYERTLDKVWPTDDGTVYWFSAIMEVQNDTSSSTWAGVKLCQDTTSDAAITFAKGYGNDVYCIGGYHGGPTDHPEEQTSYTWDSGPVWLVGEIFNRGDGNPYYIYMWVSPDPETEPDTSQADAKSYGLTMSPGISNVKVEYGGSIPFEMAVDEIHLGTTFSDVITGVKEIINKPLPTQYTLSQNYPNPFNPTTRIDYTVPNSGFVTLKIYNILGQEVRTLFAGDQNAGNYVATFDGTGLASGVYIYQLTAGNTSISKKLILMK